MSLRNKIIGTASALTLAGFIASPAFAMDGFNGLLGVDYSNIDVEHAGSANAYGANATGMFDIGSQFALQGDGGYHHLDGSSGSGSANNWNIDGTAFWTDAAGRIGAVVGYTDSSGSSSTDLHATNYGAFGNWYATQSITVGVKGGGFSASGDTTGEYAGVALTGYITPDFSLEGGFDYTRIEHNGNENDWSVKAEYLFSEHMPIAAYVGYTNSTLTGGGPTFNVFSVGLTYFCDPVGPESLEAHQRTGAEQWGNSFGPTVLKF